MAAENAKNSKKTKTDWPHGTQSQRPTGRWVYGKDNFDFLLESVNLSLLNHQQLAKTVI